MSSGSAPPFTHPPRKRGQRRPLLLTLWYASLFVAGSLAIVVLTYFLTSASLRARDQQIIQAKVGEYATVYLRGGIRALAATVQAEQRTAPERLFVRVIDGGTESAQVGRVVQEKAVFPIHNLILNSAHRARDDRTFLPHRLGNRQTESLRQALLHDHRGMPLNGVDDGGLLVGIAHRRAGKVDSVACRMGKSAPEVETFGHGRRRLGIVGDAGDGRTNQEKVCAKGRVDMPGEALKHSRHILHPVPARYLDHQRRLGWRWRSTLEDVGTSGDATRRSVATSK